MSPPLLSLRQILVHWGDAPVLDGIDLHIRKRDRLCLVGRNGCGKSTLMKVINGSLEVDGGEIIRHPGSHTAYLPQEPSLDGYRTLLDYVAAGLSDHHRDQLHRAEPWFDAFALDRDKDPECLSGGERRRAALARALIDTPDILLLDEPTNHLDLTTISMLEDILEDYPGAVVLISHDRAFLSRLATATLWLDRGRLRRLDAGFDRFEDWADGILEREEIERRKLDKQIASEIRWSHQGITARRKRNQGRLRRLQEMRQAKARQLARVGRVKLKAETDAMAGKLVVEAEGLHKCYQDLVVIGEFSTRIQRGDKIGVIGPNGAGKTTLLNLLTGRLAPDAGSVRLGTNLKTAYLDQQRSDLDDKKTLWETLCPSGGNQVMVRGRPRHVVAYLRDFLFDDRQAKAPVGSLSGGERNRLLLALALAKPSNFLVLDEPTNDLDMDTLDLLQEMLADYTGTLLLVSHDRDFLDRVVTSTIALEGDGTAVEYAGGYQDYLKQKTPNQQQQPKQSKSASSRLGKNPSANQKRQKKPIKLSYKETRALETLPIEMESLRVEIADLGARLEDPELYQRDRAEFDRVSDRLHQAQASLEQTEEQWLELEILREEVEQGGSNNDISES